MRDLYLLLILALITFPLSGQDDIIYLQDSILCEQGIPGTLEYEPESRIYFTQHDEQGRPLEQIRERRSENGVWFPSRRRVLAYENDRLSERLLQRWDFDASAWTDERKDHYTYQDDLLQVYLRQRAQKAQLVNYRRWSYAYTEEGDEKLVLLEQWNGSDWENLSRKVQEYTDAGLLENQLLQVWMNGDWRNVKVREWQYEQAGGQARVAATVVRVWSSQLNDWLNQLRQVFVYDNGRWIRSRIETWNANTQQWVNEDRMVHYYDAQNRPIGQALQRWEGEWVNSGQVAYTFQDREYISRIQTWDRQSEEWTNFLRYRVLLDDRNLLQLKEGMQAWDPADMQWENQAFTQRYTYSWSEAIVNSTQEAKEVRACVVPNPYSIGSYFFCDLPPQPQPYRVELFDMLGRSVYQQNLISGSAVSIDRRPAAGMYLLRIHNGRQTYHIQRLVIP